jgi:glutamine---fructose-6-phosphate transaminase (isomerizing)
MCGIIGILGKDPASPRLIEGLRGVMYRGYDSAGIATLVGGKIERRRAAGKLAALEEAIAAKPLKGVTGIGHTRWATHGKATEANAHPHATANVAIVHNGIIENFRELRSELDAAGRTLESETDTEVIVHHISMLVEKGIAPREAVRQILHRLEGAFAIAVIFAGEEDLMIGARRGSPLAVGKGDGEMFLGSDQLALAPMTHTVAFLQEGDWCVLTRTSVEFFDKDDTPVDRPFQTVAASLAAAEKGNYRHFMLKEIYEQPETTGRTIGALIDPMQLAAEDIAGMDFSKLTGATMIACGTAHYATRIAEYWFEQIGRLAVETDIASEFRYRDPVFNPGNATIVVSQSGETADTLEALRLANAAGAPTLGIVNVQGSAIWREAKATVPTLAGTEIGVASTKAFTAQLGALAVAAIACGRQRGVLSRDAEIRMIRALLEVPRLLTEALKMDESIEKLSHDLSKARDVLYLGRGVYSALAYEGALKLKEISYIHAEGYAAGELKHGPIALIDEATPVVVIAPFDALFEKTLSSMEQVKARGGKVILISDEAGIRAAGDTPWHRIQGPTCDAFIAPIVYSAPVQLLAYHTAVAKGTDVDQPRNLAKSVTVE